MHSTPLLDCAGRRRSPATKFGGGTRYFCSEHCVHALEVELVGEERASVTPGLRRWSDRIPTEAHGRRADIT